MKTYTKLEAGSVVSRRRLRSASGAPVEFPLESTLVHLQFRRFAGCPICSLHLRSFAQRHNEIERAGVREIVFFHSTAEDLQKYEGDLPFTLVPDPDKRLYKEFGVEASIRAFMKRSAWPPIFRGLAHAVRSVVREHAPLPPVIARGGRHGLPCDVLLDPAGVVLACKYGTHADDQWSVDELIELVAQSTATDSPAAPHL